MPLEWRKTVSQVYQWLVELGLLIETRRLRKDGIAVLKYQKDPHTEKMLNLFCQRNAVRVFSVGNPEIDGASHPL